MVMIVFGLLVPLAGSVTTLLPLGRIVTTLPPGSVLVSPLGPPKRVVTIPLPPFEHGETIELGTVAPAEVGVVELLGPSIMVTTLPFGRVVATAVPQTVEFCAGLFVALGRLVLFDMLATLGRLEPLETVVFCACAEVCGCCELGCGCEACGCCEVCGTWIVCIDTTV